MQFTIDKNLTIKGTRGDYGTIHITFDRDMTGTSGKFIVKKNAATRDEDAFLVKSFVFGLNPAITGKELVLSLTPHDTAEMPIERPESPYTFESDFENIEFVDYIWTIKLINGQEEEIIIPRSGCPNPTFRLYNEAYIGRPGRPIIPGCPPRWDMFVTKHDFLNYAAGERQITDRLSGRITALDSRLSQTEASLHVDMTNLSKDVDSKLAATKAELNEKLSKSENRLEDKIDAKNTETRFELGNRIDANQKLIVNHDTKIASLDSRVTVLEQKDRNIDALKAQVETNTKNILKNAQGIDEAKTDVAALNTRVTATELEMNQVLSAVAGYSQRIGTCETKVAACEAKVGSMDARMANCENVVSELGTTMRDTLSSFSSRINGAETKANEAKILSENATTKVNNLEAVVNNTNGRVTTLETNSGILSTTVSGVMARMTVAEGQVTNLNTSVVTLSGNVITNNAKVDALTTRVGTAEGGITSLGTQIAALDTEVHTCQEKVIAVENFVVQTRAELTGAVDGINRRLTGRMDGIDAKMEKVVGEVLSSDATTKVTVLRDTAMYVENIWNPGRTPHTCDERVIGTDILNINDVIQTLNDHSVSLSGAAASADVELQNQISLLSSAASTADEALATAISTLSSNASTADATLANAISTLSGNASTADAELATAIANEATAREGAVTSLSSNVVTALALKVNTADTIIPGMATSADTGKWSSAWAIREFVNSSIEQSTAFFRGSFANKAALDAVAWQTTDPAAANYVTNNDYAYVTADETHANEAWRYKYKLETGASDNGWKEQYKVNDTPFTDAQLNALNSGITASDWTSAKSTISTTSSNLATVSSNLGTVSSNLATLSGSAGTTSANIGTVSSNLSTLSGSVGTVSSNVGTVSSNLSTLSGSVGTVSSNLSTLSGSVGTISGNVGTISGNVTGLKTNLGKVQLGGSATSAISKLNPLIGVNLLKKSGDKVAIDTNVAYDDENVVNFLVAVVNTLIGQVS